MLNVEREIQQAKAYLIDQGEIPTDAEIRRLVFGSASPLMRTGESGDPGPPGEHRPKSGPLGRFSAATQIKDADLAYMLGVTRQAVNLGWHRPGGELRIRREDVGYLIHYGEIQAQMLADSLAELRRLEKRWTLCDGD